MCWTSARGDDERVLVQKMRECWYMTCGRYFSHLPLILKNSDDFWQPGSNAFGFCPNRRLIRPNCKFQFAVDEFWSSWQFNAAFFLQEGGRFCITSTNIAGLRRRLQSSPTDIVYSILYQLSDHPVTSKWFSSGPQSLKVKAVASTNAKCFWKGNESNGQELWETSRLCSIVSWLTEGTHWSNFFVSALRTFWMVLEVLTTLEVLTVSQWGLHLNW